MWLVDEDGFFCRELDKWSEEFAQAYAYTLDMEGMLMEQHWKIINYMRYFSKFGIPLSSAGFGKGQRNRQEEILRTIPHWVWPKGACKLAGLSKPPSWGWDDFIITRYITINFPVRLKARGFRALKDSIMIGSKFILVYFPYGAV